jgi:hypothetical protein
VLILPIQTPNHEDDMLVVVLDDDNLARMAAADPAEVRLADTGRTLVNPRVLICHEPDSPAFTRLLQTRDLAKIVEHLTRGFRFRPEAGDYDGPPRPMREGN